MRTLGEESRHLELGVSEVHCELRIAEFALHVFIDVFAADAKFAFAVWASDVVAAQFDFDHAGDLLQRNKFGNLDAVRLKIGIQKGAAVLAMKDIWRHVFAAGRTGAAGPSWHDCSRPEKAKPRGSTRKQPRRKESGPARHIVSNSRGPSDFSPWPTPFRSPARPPF